MTTFAPTPAHDDHFTMYDTSELLSSSAFPGSAGFGFDFQQQFAQLDSAVHSARWMAGYNFDSAAEEPPLLSYSPPPLPALNLNSKPETTIGDFLQKLPEHHVPSTSAGRSSIAARRTSYDFADESHEIVIKPFISKLRALLDAPQEYSDCLCWDATGTSLIISNASPRLLQVVLPESFGHSNLASFTRQLNVYGFKRLSQEDLSAALDTPATSSYSGWSHTRFIRHDSSLLHTLTPKPSRARMQKKLEKAARAEEEKRRRDKKISMSAGSGGDPR